MPFRSTIDGSNVLPFPGRGTAAVLSVADPSTELLPVLIVLHQETSTPAGSVTRCGRSATGWISAARALATPCRKPWTSMPAP